MVVAVVGMLAWTEEATWNKKPWPSKPRSSSRTGTFIIELMGGTLPSPPESTIHHKCEPINTLCAGFSSFICTKLTLKHFAKRSPSRPRRKCLSNEGACNSVIGSNIHVHAKSRACFNLCL